MKEDRIQDINPLEERSRRIRVVDMILKTGAIFIILEPIWMLLPFAGFLYGSVMHIEYLSKNPYTAWLVNFVFPTHSFFPLGVVLIVFGLTIFCVGAFQIYSAKMFKKGLVKTGIYKKFRNPQYVALTLFGVGIILTWGRFITFICFFIMMWLYYYLAKSEERKCLALFGQAYEAYRMETYFLFPGERVLASIFRRLPLFNLPGWGRAVISFVLVLALSIGSGLMIQGVKQRIRKMPPSIVGSVALSVGGESHVKLVMVKGPALQAAPFEGTHHQYMDKAFEMLSSSAKIKTALTQLNLGDQHTLLAFLKPGSNWHDGAHRDDNTAKIDVYMVVAESSGNEGHGNLLMPGTNNRFVKLIKAQALSYGRLTRGQDPTEGEVVVSGPPAGVDNRAFTKKIEDRIKFFSSGL